KSVTAWRNRGNHERSIFGLGHHGPRGNALIGWRRIAVGPKGDPDCGAPRRMAVDRYGSIDVHADEQLHRQICDIAIPNVDGNAVDRKVPRTLWHGLDETRREVVLTRQNAADFEC